MSDQQQYEVVRALSETELGIVQRRLADVQAATSALKEAAERYDEVWALLTGGDTTLGVLMDKKALVRPITPTTETPDGPNDP